MCRVPSELERQYHRFLEGRGAIASSLVLRLRGKRRIESDSGAWSALLLSRIYTVKGRLSLASSYLRLSRDLFLMGDSKEVPLGLWVNRAVILKMQGKYREATGLLRRIFRLSLEKGDIYVSAKTALNLALILARISDFKEAEIYLEYASLNYSILGCGEEMVRVELARSFIESRKGGGCKAIDRLQDQLSLGMGNMSIRERFCSRLLISEILLKNGEYEKAGIFLEDIKYDKEILDRFRPLKIRWLILRARFEEALGKQAAARHFKKAAKLESSLSGVVDPESGPGKKMIDHELIIEKPRSYKQLPLSRGDRFSLAEEPVSVTAMIKVERPHDSFLESEFISNDIRMNLILEEIKKFSPFPLPILLVGESGTGKEVVAKLIHRWSGRGEYPFIPVNTAAMPADLFEAQLFGHTKGAFTGAVCDHRGLIAAAGRGTIFLDEIGELAPQFQAKLLRFLENGEYICVGDSRVRMSGARIIAATNRDLAGLAERGRFRSDFYYRMTAFTAQLPPLRERGDDLTLLSEYFLENISRRFHLGPFNMGIMLKGLFNSYSWPGNVRELKNELTSAAIRRKRGKLRVCDLSSRLISRSIESVRSNEHGICDVEQSPNGKDIFTLHSSVPDTLELRLQAIEKKELLLALNSAGGNKAKAALMLGLKRTTFLYRLKRYGLDLK